MKSKGKIRIHVISAKFKKNSDIIGKMDPYIEFKIGQIKKKTKICKDAGTQPFFNEIIYFDINNQQKNIQIYAKDKDTISDDFLGCNTLNIIDYINQPTLSNKKQITGQIRSQIRFEDTLIANLQITVKEALLKRDTQVIGKMDPYCLLSLGTQKKKTSVKDSAGKTPKWNQKFNFNLIDINNALEIKIMDKDVTMDDIIGQCSIKGENLIKMQGTQKIKLLYKNKQAGQLTLIVIHQL